MDERQTRLELATPTLARLCSTNWAIATLMLHFICEEEETRTPTTQLSLPPQSSASTNSATSPTYYVYLFPISMCPEQDSNLHVVKHTHLKRARLPIPPPGQLKDLLSFYLFRTLSGKRDLNSRPQPWQGCALPTELLPHHLLLMFCLVL